MLYRTKLMFWFVLLILIPMGLLGAILGGYSVQTMRKTTVEQTMRTIQSSMKSVEFVFDDINRAFIDVVSSQEMHKYLDANGRANASAQYDILLARLTGTVFSKPFYINNFHVYPAGEQLLTVSSYKSSSSKRFEERFRASGLYGAAIAKEGVIQWNLVKFPDIPTVGSVHRDGHIALVSCAIVRMVAGELVSEGVACMQLNYWNLHQLFDQIYADDTAHTIVLTRDQTVFNHRDVANVGTRFDDTDNILGRIAEEGGDDGYFEIETSEGPTHVLWAHSPSSGFTILSFLPDQIFAEKVQPMVLVFYTLLAFMLLASLVAAWMLSKSVSKPVSALLEAMRRIDRDHLDVSVHLNRKDEFGMLSHQLNELMARIRSLVTQVEEEQRRKREAELTALRAQVAPHFLYNTLHVIKCLAKAGNTADVQGVTDNLVSLLRLNISNDRDTITLDEELRVLGAYVSIQNLRLDLEFSLENHIDPRLYHYQIKKFTLQPLVENCIMHGFENRENNMITLSAREVGGDIELIVQDNGVGLPKDIDPESLVRGEMYRFNGIGVANINERIKLSYGNQYGVELRPAEPSGTMAIVRLPAMEAESFT